MISPDQVANMIKSEFDKSVRAQMRVQNGIVGYAVEVVREIKGEEYQYVGWISLKALNTEPWPADQRAMADRAFEAVLKEKMN